MLIQHMVAGSLPLPILLFFFIKHQEKICWRGGRSPHCLVWLNWANLSLRSRGHSKMQVKTAIFHPFSALKILWLATKS